MSWREVGDGVFHRRYQPWDVGVCAVRGAAGLCVVDTRASLAEGERLRVHLAELGGPVLAVVNTHAHFDHCFGNPAFAGAPTWAHELMPEYLATHDQGSGAPPAPTELVARAAVLDLGDRAVELLHLGRGHTHHDLVLHVPNARVWLVGDLVEESGPPSYGDDSFPLEWPATLAALVDHVEPGELLVPGHGEPVPRDFAAAQQRAIGQVATLIRELYARRVPAGTALEAGGGRWPYDPRLLDAAVRRGYRALAGTPAG